MSKDLIDRQAAIDAFDCTNELIVSGEANARNVVNYINKVVGKIKDLPSAQPEIVRCKDCRHGVDYYHDGDCYCSNPKWGLKYFGGSWEFYCGDAERRADERTD